MKVLNILNTLTDLVIETKGLSLKEKKIIKQAFFDKALIIARSIHEHEKKICKEFDSLIEENDND